MSHESRLTSPVSALYYPVLPCDSRAEGGGQQRAPLSPPHALPASKKLQHRPRSAAATAVRRIMAQPHIAASAWPLQQPTPSSIARRGCDCVQQHRCPPADSSLSLSLSPPPPLSPSLSLSQTTCSSSCGPHSVRQPPSFSLCNARSFVGHPRQLARTRRSLPRGCGSFLSLAVASGT